MKFNGTMRINTQGHLEIGGCDTVDLAQRFGTPLYVMDEALLRDNCRRYYQSFVVKHGQAEVIYASKAFLNLAMCCLVEEEGLGLDVVSGGELYTALRAKFPPHRIYFHGNNKSIDELKMALEAKIGRIVVDNLPEMELLQELAADLDTKANVLLRITPGIEAHTHEYIKTGQIDSKFGFPLATGQAKQAVERALTLPNLAVKGLHCHIGSQIFEMESYRHAVQVMLDFVADVTAVTGLVVEELNLGGGFGIYYSGDDAPVAIEEYADVVMSSVREEAAKRGLTVPKVIVEPGRSIAGPAGTTLYTIGTIKEIPGIRTYVAVDGGMADNPRPALYGARYEAILANRATEAPEAVVSITGKCCESGDMLIWDTPLAPASRGDILAISATGAYNYTMSMNYNRLGRPAVVFVRDGEADLVVEREDYEDLIRNDRLPERMKRQKVVKLASMK